MKPSVRGLIALILIAFGVRAAAVVEWPGELGLRWHENLQVDTDSYLRLATNWSQSGTYGFEDAAGNVAPSAFRPPLYPWLLSWAESGGVILAVWIAVMNVVLGVTAVWLTWSIGRQLGLKWTWVAGLAVAVDPVLLRASQSAMTETLAATLALAVWRTWLFFHDAGSKSICDIQRERTLLDLPLASATIGLLLGIAILARPTAAPWALLCVGTMLIIGSSCWKRRWFHALLASAMIAVCVLPWTLRNWTQIGKPIWATSHGGYTLLLANNPLLYEHFKQNGPSRNWDAEPFHAAWAARGGENNDVATAEFWEQASGQSVSVAEQDDDGLAYRAAQAAIEREPAMFALSCCYRVGWLWAWWPNQSSLAARVAIGGWYGIWFLLALSGLVRLFATSGSRKWVPALLLAFTLTAVHAIYWSNMRMRAPVVSAVYLLAVSSFGKQQTDHQHKPTNN